MGKFVPIRKGSFGVSKICYQQALMFVHFILFVRIFKRGKKRLLQNVSINFLATVIIFLVMILNIDVIDDI